MKTIGIIGAGASGLACALKLVKLNAPFHIDLYDSNSKIGKKLLATGNGRCNLSNAHLNVSSYGGDIEVCMPIVEAFNIHMLAKDLNIFITKKGDLYYPYSLSSKTVVDAFITQLKDHVTFHLDCKIQTVQTFQDGFQLINDKHQRLYCDDLIFACGGHAGQGFGTDGSSFKLFDQLHLSYAPLKPSLVSFKTKENVGSMKGCRVQGRFTLLYERRPLYHYEGEALFTDHGISGIAMMQLSRFYDETKPGVYEIVMDICPELDQETLGHYFKSNADTNQYLGIVNEKVAIYLYKRFDTRYKQALKQLTFTISGTKGFEFAQVSRGGVLLSQCDQHLEIKTIPHCFVIGEALNVDGDCGGFNLHFAFSTAYHVAKYLIEREALTHEHNSVKFK